MKLLTIVGTRPQFIKAAAISRGIRDHNIDGRGNSINEVIVDTGQHFQRNMSKVFFDQLDIPIPKYNLGVAKIPHGAMTGRMLEGIETISNAERPDWMLVYGDTNSTLAGALAAAKLGVPLAHVEAGLRSYNPLMPEEINRILTDRVSTLLFCPNSNAVSNLHREGYPYPAGSGITQQIFNVGDVMYDNVIYYREIAKQRVSLNLWGVEEKSYAVCTLHRQESTNNPLRLNSILSGLRDIANQIPVIVPLHPRTQNILHQQGALSLLEGLLVVPPLPYLEMQRLLMSARVLLTDSGGMQKEAYYHKIPCITLREETEWAETTSHGWNQVVGYVSADILNAFNDLTTPEKSDCEVYGSGDAVQKILLNIQAIHIGNGQCR